jgi:hypothetical protein
MFGGLFIRNLGYAVKHPVRTWRVRKACQDHVKKNPLCAWCNGINKVEAHHVVPLWKDESLGSDSSNFISLCSANDCHRVVGHNGYFATRYVSNVLQVCGSRTTVLRENYNG